MRSSGRLWMCASGLMAGLMLLLPASVAAQVITTIAGGFVGDSGPATRAGLDYPRYVLQDSSGNTYISDSFNHRIRKIDSTGTISTYAGTGIAGFSGDGGPANKAMLSFPTGIQFDAVGNILLSDGGNNRIRKINTSTGVITTIAGTGTAGYTGDGGPALQAELNDPWALSLDRSGNLFFTDVLNNVVRKIDASGIISTAAGNGIEGYSGDGGPAILAELDLPRTVVVDTSGNLFIADTMNHRVRKVDTTGTITTFAGNGIQGFSGDGGPATLAEIGNPRGLLIKGNQLLISNGGQSHIRTVNFSSNIIKTFAGAGLGYNEGNPLTGALFNGETGMFLTKSGTLLLGDQANGRLRQISSSTTSTVAGSFGRNGIRATSGVLISPENLAFDSAGNYYIAEDGGNRIRKVDASGRLTTVAGTGITGYSGDGGPANQAQLNVTFGVAIDSSGNLFISDTGNNVIRKVNTSGVISTFATDANFADLLSLATDSAGNLYIADDASCVIFKVTPAATVSIVAGNLACGYNSDGIKATAAELNSPYGVAVDTKGNIYIGDTLNNRIRKVNGLGVISTIAGNGTCGFSGDGGPSTAALICNPENLTVDTSGNVYFGDYLNLRVREISAGTINTIAGSGNSGYNGENLPALSTNVDGPIGVGVDNLGGVYILDDVQARVRKIH